VAREVAGIEIRVNAVRPGLVSTGLTQQVIADPERQRAIEDSIPAGRLGRPEEIADAVMWLMSDHAAWVSGAHLNVSGGGFKISGSF
jgi:NAD(P)-dependent dehydrogenase (short-subunit alcohol dehydrogenase family)